MNYLSLKNKAYKLITKFGNDCKLIRRGEEDHYNPETDEYESDETIFLGKAVLDSYEDSMIDGTVIKVGDVKLLCSFDEEPIVNDNIEFGNKIYSVISIKPIKPDGVTNIMYTIQGR